MTPPEGAVHATTVDEATLLHLPHAEIIDEFAIHKLARDLLGAGMLILNGLALDRIRPILNGLKVSGPILGDILQLSHPLRSFDLRAEGLMLNNYPGDRVIYSHQNFLGLVRPFSGLPDTARLIASWRAFKAA